jgi:hypothetical protein
MVWNVTQWEKCGSVSLISSFSKVGPLESATIVGIAAVVHMDFGRDLK